MVRIHPAHRTYAPVHGVAGSDHGLVPFSGLEVPVHQVLAHGPCVDSPLCIRKEYPVGWGLLVQLAVQVKEDEDLVRVLESLQSHIFAKPGRGLAYVEGLLKLVLRHGHGLYRSLDCSLEYVTVYQILDVDIRRLVLPGRVLTSKLEHAFSFGRLAAVVAQGKPLALHPDPLSELVIIVKRGLSYLDLYGSGLILDVEAAVDVAGNVSSGYQSRDDQVFIYLEGTALVKGLEFGNGGIGIHRHYAALARVIISGSEDRVPLVAG